ncbi:hypothetical protein ACPWT1_16185 [Ramlibacter sp. MMS24-I3-19]|uniref:hypothetical protein n=1 Tax=Ramlibacter sp. MMS24-I3-19 TaxID=3416606 RepID=UPI003CFD2E32
MASARALARLDALTWTLIYGGLFAIVLGIVTGNAHLIAGWSLGVLGGCAVVAGIVLIFVRSRLRETPLPGAQSPGTPNNNRRHDTR